MLPVPISAGLTGDITGHYLAVDDGGPDRQLAEHFNQAREASAEPRSAAAVEFHLSAEFVDLDAEAVEFDLVLPIVGGWHRLGALRMAGLDELEEHASLVGEPRVSRRLA